MVDRTESADVAVVGCGPGGAVLSYLLARSGVSVTLIERESTFEREYRGFGWNPGVIRLFDEMDLLDDVLTLAHEKVTDGTVSLYGQPLELLDFDRFDTAYPFALMMEQPALLECLVDHASRYEAFSFFPATTVTDLRMDHAGAVRGVEARDREAAEHLAFEANVVIGADGRYSTVRSSAGIDPGFFKSPIDLVWFKLPRGAVDVATQGRIDRHGILLSFGLSADEVQIGYPVREGEWAAIREAGFDTLCDRIAAVDPRLGPAMQSHLDGFRDTTLLDISPGIAETWSREGLLLLGDAAHTASPVGAQGNPLAVEDAVVAHDLIARSLPSDGSLLSNEVLSGFETRRRPSVRRVIARQRRVATMLAFWLDYGAYVPAWFVRGTASGFGRIAPRFGATSTLIESFALGDQSVAVARSHFSE